MTVSLLYSHWPAPCQPRWTPRMEQQQNRYQSITNKMILPIHVRKILYMQNAPKSFVFKSYFQSTSLPGGGWGRGQVRVVGVPHPLSHHPGLPRGQLLAEMNINIYMNIVTRSGSWPRRLTSDGSAPSSRSCWTTSAASARSTASSVSREAYPSLFYGIWSQELQ